MNRDAYLWLAWVAALAAVAAQAAAPELWAPSAPAPSAPAPSAAPSPSALQSSLTSAMAMSQAAWLSYTLSVCPMLHCWIFSHQSSTPKGLLLACPCLALHASAFMTGA